MDTTGVWRAGGAFHGQIVHIQQQDFDRVGNCWMKGRLLEGDLAMVIQHSGDCFWTYQLVEHHTVNGSTRKRGYRLIPESSFGAYVLGTPYEYQPTTREMHLLMAGEYISMEADSEDRI